MDMTGSRIMQYSVSNSWMQVTVSTVLVQNRVLNKRYYEYENWNSDIPDPHEDCLNLYKSIPFFITLKENGVYGIFYDNTFRAISTLEKKTTAITASKR